MKATCLQSVQIGKRLFVFYFLLTLTLFYGQWLCGSFGRAVASDTRGPQFESMQREKIIEHLFTVKCVLKRRK